MRRYGWRLLVAALFAGVVGNGVVLSGASAQLASCRTDPVVQLSNGVSVTLYEDISDTSSDVTSITYALHVPAGVSITSISYVGPLPSSAQTVTLYRDENPGNYDAYTDVNTKTAGISVTAYMSADSTVSTHTNGHSGQLLHSHLHFS